MTNKYMEKDSNIYELGFHLIPTVAADDIAKEFTEIKDILSGHGASFIAEELPRTFKLAYRMEKAMGGKLHKFTSSYFGWVKFEAPRSELPAIKTAIEAHKNLLRYLLVKTVRENTYLGPKFGKKVVADAEQAADGEKPAEVKPINPEEIDKSIENLVVA